MFTGLVEVMGVVARVEEGDGSRTFQIRVPEWAGALTLGQSISVDGACQTVVELLPDGFVVQAVGTTLGRTTLGDYTPGRKVNLERSLLVGARLDGHFVQGHVDGVGTVVELRKEGDHHLMEVRIPTEVWRHTLLHGSITLDGVSLTVNRRSPGDLIEVAVIPHSWEVTTLSHRKVGDPVNVEGDLIGKYVGNLLSSLPSPTSTLPGPGSHDL